jgi:hypothetical protein
VDAAGSVPECIGAGADQCGAGGEGEAAGLSLTDAIATEGVSSGGAGGAGSSEAGETGAVSSSNAVVDGVMGVDDLGGGDDGVVGHGREVSSDVSSITSYIIGGGEDDLLGGE